MAFCSLVEFDSFFPRDSITLQIKKIFLRVIPNNLFTIINAFNLFLIYGQFAFLLSSVLYYTFFIFAFGRMAQSTIKYNLESEKFSKVTIFFLKIIRKITWNFSMWKVSYHKNCYCCFSHLSHVQLFVTPWTIVRQVPLSMGFSRQEYWSGLSFPSSGNLLDPGIEPGSPALQAGSCTTGGFFTD